jgi:DNA adenine methylase
LAIKNEGELRIQQLIADLKQPGDILPLASKEIVTLLSQHLNCKGSSRLPVLIIASAYQAIKGKIGEVNKLLKAHTAADKQPGSIGDIEITLTSDDRVVTCYEVKDKRVGKTGVEFTVLDCIGFIRHLLHFFHRQRIGFLDTYQEMVLAEPTSSVSQPLKEASLALRRAAEADRR